MTQDRLGDASHARPPCLTNRRMGRPLHRSPYFFPARGRRTLIPKLIPELSEGLGVGDFRRMCDRIGHRSPKQPWRRRSLQRRPRTGESTFGHHLNVRHGDRPPLLTEATLLREEFDVGLRGATIIDDAATEEGDEIAHTAGCLRLVAEGGVAVIRSI